jgi:hypothetical protein
MPNRLNKRGRLESPVFDKASSEVKMDITYMLMFFEFTSSKFKTFLWY